MLDLENSLSLLHVLCTTLKVILVSLVLLKLFQLLTIGRCKSPKCLIGKTAIVTGGSSGMGFETALVLASRGCRVIIADINPSQKPKKEIIARTNNSNIELKYLDLGSFKSVREFAADINQTEPRLDILINNAGVGARKPQYTEDGLHPTMQINHFGSFLLTHLLVDLLKKSAPSRIVFTSSLFAYLSNITRQNLNYPTHHANNLQQYITIYSNSKLCNVISAKGFNKRLERFGVTAYSVHPGAVRTNFEGSLAEEAKLHFEAAALHYIFFTFYAKSPYDGAQSILHAALSDEALTQGGQYFADCIPGLMPWKAQNELFCDDIWRDSEQLTGLLKEEKLGL